MPEPTVNTHPKYVGPLAGQDHSKIIPHSNPVVDFLMRLKRIDDLYVTPRDLLCLYALIKRPGMSKQDLSDAVGLPAPSNVTSNVERLIRWGYIEDRRENRRQASPHQLYPLQAGVEFWENVKP